MDGDDGFRAKLNELNRAGISGPGHDYGLDWSDSPFFRPALWQATWKNHEGIIKLLVEKGATIAWADYQGRTPLHEAAFYGYTNLIEYFIEKGHPIDPLDNFGHTPLFRAVDAGNDNIVELLIERKAQINFLDSDGVTLQHIAGFNGRPDMSERLLYQGAWKNRFAMEEKPPAIAARSSASVANDPGVVKAMITELPPEENTASMQESKTEEVRNTPRQPQESNRQLPRSQFSDP